MIANIEIRRPNHEDVEELHHFFELVINHTFAREGLANLVDVIEDEIKDKKGYLREDLESNGIKHYFLIAVDNERVIATIEYGPANQIIVNCTQGELKDVVEVGTVFVHPDFQGQGIGTMMLDSIYLVLKNKNIEEFCLDSGYATAQKIWRKKLGEPDYLLKNYWGDGYHHMIWRRSIV